MENLLKPNREEFAKKLAITNFTNKEIEFLNAYNWENEIFEKEGMKGLKNCIEEQIIAPHYEDFMLLTNDSLQVGDKVVTCHNRKWGILKTNGNKGEWILSPEYDRITYPNRYLACLKNEKWAVYDIQDNQWMLTDLDNLTYNEGFLFCNGVAFFSKNNKEGVLLSTGEFTAPIFDEIDYAIEEPFKVRIANEWGFINEEGVFTTDEDEAYFMDVDY